MEDNNYYPGKEYQRLFNAISDANGISTVDEMKYVIKVVHEDFPQRFTMPTDEQLIKFALIFNDGKLDAEELANMTGMAQFILDRLHENGDIMIPSSKEKEDESQMG